jgi:hypothetical protein
MNKPISKAERMRRQAVLDTWMEAKLIEREWKRKGG